MGTANQLSNKRNSMIKVPSRLAIDIDESGNIVLTLAGGINNECYSFMLSKRMANDLGDGLMTACEMASELQTFKTPEILN